MSAVAEEPSPFQQYPLRCGVLASMGKGRVHRVAAIKAYWRADLGERRSAALLLWRAAGMPGQGGCPGCARMD